MKYNSQRRVVVTGKGMAHLQTQVDKLTSDVQAATSKVKGTGKAS